MAYMPVAKGVFSAAVIFVSAGVGGYWVHPAPVLAQVTPDDTLGEERSRLRQEASNGIDVIEGGAARGANLFHSFEQFNINEGQSVYFANPDGITNILSRVTGKNPSNILGRLGVLGDANLFLLNPNGILFGPNAQLDVRGSFLAATADAIQFGDQGFFSATNPEAPPLLTVNPSALLFNQIQSGDIINRSIAPAGVDPVGQPASGLRAGDGATLTLLGGNVNLEGGRINAFEGRSEIGAVSGVGTIALNPDSSLSFPSGVERSDVSLTNGAAINTAAGGGGNIAINARNINLSGGSTLTTGILAGLGGEGARSGDIRLDATGSIRLTEQSQLVASTFGQGNAGNILVRATGDTTFVSNTTTELFTGIRARVEQGARGKAGNIQMSARSLTVTDGGLITTSIFGQGNAGNINIHASEAIFLDGTGFEVSITSGLAVKRGQAISSNVSSGARGNAGNIRISAPFITLTDGFALNSSLAGEGEGGSIVLEAAERVALTNGAVLISQVQPGGVGNGGNIRISTPDFSAENFSFLTTSNIGGNGNAGDLQIFANSIVVSSHSQIASITAGQGNGGNISIRARDSISLDRGANHDDDRLVFFTGIATSATDNFPASFPVNPIGQGGNITIHTSRLYIARGASIEANTANAYRGGNIAINSNTLTLLEGGSINSVTENMGQAGNITLQVGEHVLISGRDSRADRIRELVNRNFSPPGIYLENSGIYTSTLAGSRGDGGNIVITAGDISLRDAAIIVADSMGQGEGGNIQIEAGKLFLEEQARISGEAISNNGGNLLLQVDNLLLRDRSNITTEAGTQGAGGNGGNITINSPLIVAVPNEDSNINANAFRGNGGNIDITTESIFGLQTSEQPTLLSDITASSQFGLSGDISITTPEVNPSQGLVELPSTIVDASQQIAQTCSPNEGETLGEFVVTGRGGLPPDPTGMVENETVVTRLAILDESTPPENSDVPSSTLALGQDLPSSVTMPPIVEAQGWTVDAEGNVALVAQPDAVTPNTPAFNSVACNRR